MMFQVRFPIMATLLMVLSLWNGASVALADPGKPVAVRWWGHAMVSIETYWNLHIVIDPYSTDIGYDDLQVSADLVLITHEHPDHNNAALVGGEPIVVHGLDDADGVRRVHHVLDRLPNAKEPWWKDARLRIARSEHAIVVTSIPAWHDADDGVERGANAMFLIEVDGVRIVHCGDLGQRELSAEQLSQLGKVDLLLVPVGGTYTVDGPQAAAIVRQVKPRIVVPIHYKTPALKFDLAPVEPFLDALGSDFEVMRPAGNTVAVSAAKDGETGRPKVVVPKFVTWEMSGEMAPLFDRMDNARRSSQAVFAPLSANQMNFKPSNGTHTPRWNAEHMMGRELGFFTQIYAGLDPAVPHIDLNPEQMPPDYKAAHPDWSGAEEARQMERTGALVRRFACLLDGMELDSRPAGSPWTLRGLLEQMERHYGEHTANVQKKFELPDWPEE
jgi:L-ascorbate metabolism protein UlaG (beta-lactamase superfamily)